MTKPRKLSSGTWNVRVLAKTDADGTRHYKSFTAPTKAEVVQIAKEYEDLISRAPRASFGCTVGQAIDRYIALCDVLSPTTVAAYKKIKEYAFRGIMDAEVSEIDDTMMQAAINSEAKRKNERTGNVISPKTVKNEWCLVSSAIKSVCGRSYNIRLPKIQRTLEDLPEPEDVMNSIIGSDVELPCLLAMWMSLRMSEIRGLMCSSVRNGYLYIESVVVDVNNKEVRKSSTKTAGSRRRVKIPDYIMSLINNTTSYQNYALTGENRPLIAYGRRYIYYHFTKLMEENGLSMSFHDLRHEFASISISTLGLPAKSVQATGGWSSSLVLDATYSQTFDKMQKDADAKRENYLESILGDKNVERQTSNRCKS